MTKQIEIPILSSDDIGKRVIDFLGRHNFTLSEATGSFLKFRQQASLLDAWKTNPIKWGSEISIAISHNSIKADFQVDTTAQMNTAEEDAVWQTFIKDFQAHVTTGATESSQLELMISQNKKTRLSYFAWAISGALIGGILALLYTKLTNNHSTISLLIIPVVATTFLSWKINVTKAKDAF